MTLLQLKTYDMVNKVREEDKLESYDREMRDKEISVLDLCRTVPITMPNETCREVMNKFKRNSNAPCIVYCTEPGLPEGIIMREAFYHRMSGMFSREIYDPRPASFMVDMNPMKVEVSESLSQLLYKALDRPESHFYDCVLLIENEKLLGVLTVKDLLQLSTTLQEAAKQEREFILNESYRHTREIEMSLDQVSEAAEKTRIRSERMKEWSLSGKTNLEQVGSSYISLVSGMEEQAHFVSDLLKNAENISSITKQISELADYSSLLAMNASIEAAHAGHHGQGFQVVAREVRSFAKQTMKLSADISQLLIHIQHIAQETAEAAAASLSEIRSCERVVAMGGSIFEQLAQTVEEVRDAGTQVYHLSEDTTARVKRVRQELSQMNGSLSYDIKDTL